MSSRPAQPCMSSIPLGLAPQACTALHNLCFASHAHQSLLCGKYKHALSPFRWAVPSRPAQICTIFTLQACAPKACQAGDPPPPLTHTHNLHSAGPHPPKPIKMGVHRQAGSPLCRPVPFRHAKPMLQRPTTSPQLRPPTVGPWDPTHRPLATGRLQTYLRDTHRQVWMLKN
jgi:hypothetical protein